MIDYFRSMKSPSIPPAGFCQDFLPIITEQKPAFGFHGIILKGYLSEFKCPEAGIVFSGCDKIFKAMIEFPK